MGKINKLTPDQIDRMPEWVERWTRIGLSTEPADRTHAERGIKLAYERAKKAPPLKIVWTSSPLAQGLTRAIVLGEPGNVGDSVRDSVWASVRASVGDSVWASVWASVGDSVGDSVRDSVRASVRDSVWASVGDSVRASVGDSVGDSVRDSVWASVRASVWASVGDSVRASVGDSVRDSVWDSVWASVYGQHEAGWLSFYDYFREVCGLDEQTSRLCGILSIAKSAGWFLPHEHICWISERHHRVCRNGRGQIHSHDGMAVQYPDGWGVWAWNGVRVNEQIILQPNTLTPEQIAKEVNAQVRQVMVERVGVERVCQMFNAQSIDKQGTYELLVLDLGDGRRRPYLKMLNPSIGVWHVEGVAPNTKTVQEALNFRNGLTALQIDEVNGADWYQQGDVILRPTTAKSFKAQPIILT